MRHTPLPLRFQGYSIRGAANGKIATMANTGNMKENAALIVHHVNNFDAVRFALESVTNAGSLMYEFADTDKRAFYESYLLDCLKSAKKLLSSLEPENQ